LGEPDERVGVFGLLARLPTRAAGAGGRRGEHDQQDREQEYPSHAASRLMPFRLMLFRLMRFRLMP
jgi:hypothetical protein